MDTADNLRRAYANLRDTYMAYEEGIYTMTEVEQARQVMDDAAEEYDMENPNAFATTRPTHNPKPASPPATL
jgi:hypothetical protein